MNELNAKTTGPSPGIERRLLHSKRRVLLAMVMAAAVIVLPGCSRPAADIFQGYIEGETVHVGAPVAGMLTQCRIVRGESVRRGDPLFTLEAIAEQAAVAEASNKLAQAEAILDDSRKGRRPSEIASLEGRLAQARAQAEYWTAESARKSRLLAEKTIAQAEFDQSQSERDTYLAQIRSLEADVATARLGARADEIRAAEANAAAAKASLEKARWAQDQKTQVSPNTGVVQDTLYRVGEFVGVGMPVVTLLPPENIKVRFFVPEAVVASVQVGAAVVVRVDGQPTRSAKVSFVAAHAEFTPPVIYSRETRSKLVFLVEAVFSAEDARTLHPGQPVDVKLGNAF
jgi:HlyD family secretion protein